MLATTRPSSFLNHLGGTKMKSIARVLAWMASRSGEACSCFSATVPRAAHAASSLNGLRRYFSVISRLSFPRDRGFSFFMALGVNRPGAGPWFARRAQSALRRLAYAAS